MGPGKTIFKDKIWNIPLPPINMNVLVTKLTTIE